MKLITIAGPASSGKTAIVKLIIRNFKDIKPAFLKIDVNAAFEDEEIKEEFGIPVKKVYSGDLCPDHAGIMVMDEALQWAESEKSDLLIIESAGLCLRCTPYVTQSLGIVVISAIGGIQAPIKMAQMIALSDLTVVTHTDLITQAEKEVFREKIREIKPDIDIVETNAMQGTGLRFLLKAVSECPSIKYDKSMILRGIAPLGVCTVCIGKREIGWKNHSGVIRRLNGKNLIYRGD